MMFQLPLPRLGARPSLRSLLPSRAASPALAAALCLAPVLAGCDTAPSDPFGAAQAAYSSGEPRTAMEMIEAALAASPDDPQVQMLAGDIAMALGNPDRAITEYERVVAGPASSSLARAKLAEAQVRANYLGAAKRAVDGLIYDVPLAYTAAIAYGLASGNGDLAADKLDEGLAQFPDDPRLVTVDAERLLMLGQAQDAAARVEPVLALDPPVPQAHRLAGQIAMGERNLKAAQAHFTTVLKARPTDQTAMLAMAAIARDRGDEGEAGNWINKANQAGQPHPIGLLFAAQMAYDAGEIDRAFELIEKVPTSIASDSSFARLRGFIDAARGQYASAILPLKLYVEEQPEDYLARRILAEAYAETGELANAWATIRPVLDDPQADGGALVLALELATATGNGDVAAIKQKLAARAEAPDIAEPMREAGAAIRAGDWAKADAIYAPLIEGAGKENPMLLNNAAAVKSKLSDHSAAVSLARRALAQAPESPQILDTLGWALWKEGSNPAEAKALLTKAREKAPGNREIAEHWATAHKDG